MRVASNGLDFAAPDIPLGTVRERTGTQEAETLPSRLYLLWQFGRIQRGLRPRFLGLLTP